MKNYLFASLMFYGLVSKADSSVLTESSHAIPHPYWACVAVGQEDFGPTIGVLWQTVKGIGPSESEAREVAQSRCASYGFKMCSTEVKHCLYIP